jgi:hypothetical protein
MDESLKTCFDALDLSLFSDRFRKLKYQSNVLQLLALFGITGMVDKIWTDTDVMLKKKSSETFMYEIDPVPILVLKEWFQYSDEDWDDFHLKEIDFEFEFTGKQNLPEKDALLSSTNSNVQYYVDLTDEISGQYFEGVIARNNVHLFGKLTQYLTLDWNFSLHFDKNNLKILHLHKVYLYTHIIFFLSNYGLDKIDGVGDGVGDSDNPVTNNVLINWLVQFNNDAKILQNAEIVHEIISCILITEFSKKSSSSSASLSFQIITSFLQKIILLQQPLKGIQCGDFRGFYSFHQKGVNKESEDFHHHVTAGIMFAMAIRSKKIHIDLDFVVVAPSTAPATAAKVAHRSTTRKRKLKTENAAKGLNPEFKAGKRILARKKNNFLF